MNITWFGHANFMIKNDDITILIDPFFEGNPVVEADYNTLDKVDIVLLTHDHGDHVGQALEICTAHNAELVTVFDTANKLIAQGLNPELAVGMNVGGTVELKNVKIKMVQAVHSTESGIAAGFIITFPDETTLYHAGDTALFSDMQLFPLFHDITLSMLPIGGWFTMGPKQAAYACKFLKTPKVIPMHWKTFPLLEQNTQKFQNALDEHSPNTELITLQPGESYSL